MKTLKIETKEQLDKAHMKMIKSIFEIYLLWALSKKKMHGYELMKEMTHGQVFNVKTSPATIYPLLNNLTRRGLLGYKKESTGKRQRKVYYTTKKGLEYIKMAKKLFFQRGLRKKFFEEMLK